MRVWQLSMGEAVFPHERHWTRVASDAANGEQVVVAIRRRLALEVLLDQFIKRN